MWDNRLDQSQDFLMCFDSKEGDQGGGWKYRDNRGDWRPTGNWCHDRSSRRYQDSPIVPGNLNPKSRKNHPRNT